MQRLADGTATADDHERLQREGEYLHGAFYLGSPDLYRWLRDLSDDERRAIGMRRVSEINELYGGHEALERLQRRDARFFNTCMMATVLGAAVSDALDDGRVVSGVGGQYNFVAMSHALPDARSVLMLRATRDADGRACSNIVWNYGHTTIPRHLRDVYISEYGIADLRGRSDEDCIAAMLAITDGRFQHELRGKALDHGKLRAEVSAPAPGNTPEHLRDVLAPFRRDGALPDYPLGSDFTPVEQRLVRALGWLKAGTRTRGGKLRTLLRALAGGRSDEHEAVERMGLQRPAGAGEWLEARLLGLSLRETSRD